MLRQESVWSYPRPPRVKPVPQRIRIEFVGHTIADTSRALRVLETSHPPAYYIPKDDFLRGILKKTDHYSVCEFKGTASYWSIELNNRQSENAAWSYENPTFDFESIRGFLAVYPGRVDACFVEDEKVTPQKGNFYGGWITTNLTGPFK